MKKVYVLMVDFEGKMDSRPKPIGVALENEQDAIDFGDGIGMDTYFLGFDRDYEEVEIYSNFETANECLREMEERVLQNSLDDEKRRDNAVIDMTWDLF
jgi:hypothetical protein